MTSRRLLILLLSPIWLAVVLLSLLIGLAEFAEGDLAAIVAAEISTGSIESRQLALLATRVLLFPFQLVFIGVVVTAALWVFRRRDRFGGWVLGDPLAERLTSTEIVPGEVPSVLHPDRRRTLQQFISSAIAFTAIFVATLLSLGQFVERGDLAVVVAALTSSLTWGARLPISDLLGGISNIFENNLAVGDQISYKQTDRMVGGTVESVDLRFMSVRADTGELTSIPFGELRVFRNFSRGEHIGVYAGFPIAAGDLGRAVRLLEDMAPQSMELVPDLVEPWQPISLEGEMGAILDLHLFGKTTPNREEDLLLALHTVVQERFAAEGIHLRVRGSDQS